jgi:hypothetical protein
MTAKYPYKPKKLKMFLSFFFFLLCTVGLAYFAETNDRGLDLVIIKRIVEISFSTSGASTLLWCLSVTSLLMSMAGLFGLYSAFTSKAELIITDKEIIVPGGTFSAHKTKTIPFKDIISLTQTNVAGQHLLKIVHQNGSSTINGGFLPQKKLFDDIYNQLAQAMPKASKRT